MRATLDELISEFENLETFVASIGPVNKLLEPCAESVIRQYLRGRRKLDYVAFIVSLYAAFESFVENLVWAYTKLESSRVEYSALPEKLQKKHLKQSAELLGRARLGEGRYSDVTEKEVVENLYACLSGQEFYTLNRSAVVHHDLNLRPETIQDIFARIGFDNINHRARKTERLIEWHTKIMGEDEFPQEIPENVITFRINDFVERRNQISHGSANLTDYLGLMDMHELLDFVTAYSKALYSLLVGDIIKKRYVLNSNDSEQLTLDEGDGPYQRGHVVIVNKPSITIFKGQQIIGYQNDEIIRWGRIKSIQIDDKNVEEVKADTYAEKLGVNLDFKATRGMQLFLLQKEEDVVW